MPKPPPSSDSEMEIDDRSASKSSKHFTSSSKSASTSNPKKRNSTAAVIELSSDDSEEDVKPQKKKVAVGNGAKPRASTSSSSAKASGSKAATKKKVKKSESDDDGDAYKQERSSSEEDQDEEEEEEDVKPKKKPVTKATSSSAKGKEKEKAPVKKPAAAAKKPKKEEEDGKKEEKPKPKWQYKERAGPAAPGSKEIPVGEPNCLAGLTFVFTGELQSLSREEGQDLAKRYGGRVTTAPSSKTSYVVLGSDAGPKKLEMIKKHNIKTLDEDGFLALIGTSESREDDPKYVEQQKKEQAKIKEQAKAITLGKDAPEHMTQLWTTKYAPQRIADICGNKGLVEKLGKWLEAWPKSLKSNFKKPGPDGLNAFRAVLISGPPGIGKTTSAHLIAKLQGYDVLELNASDTRSKKLLEEAFKSKISDTTISGFFNSGHSSTSGLSVNKKSLIIMDEVDGMSAGDRGGLGALNALIKKTKVPIIAIANDAKSQKMKTLQGTTFQMTFKRPTAQEIRSRIMTIAFKEGLKLDGKVVDQLVAGSQADIRQIINMLSTYKLGAKSLDYDEGKKLVRMNEKNTIQTPWNLYTKLFNPQAFSPVSGMSLTDKLEVYFQDFSIMPLFVQENYLKSKFARAAGQSGPEGALTNLGLMSKAADAISDGDLVDAMIHGPQQHWSLMPFHGMMSCVRPASYYYGSGGGYPTFPAWLGKNSTQNKLGRMLGEIQIRMRLRVSGDKREIRQSYIPALYPKLVNPLIDEGADAIEEVIELMDEYYLSKEEWDAIVELGVGDGYEQEAVLKKIDSKVKSAFTRKYNANDHPIPYHKPEAGKAKAKKLAAGGEAPDLEEAFVDDEDLPEEDDDDAAGSDTSDLGKDKLIKQKKAKAKKGGAAKDKDGEEKPAKGKGAKGKK